VLRPPPFAPRARGASRSSPSRGRCARLSHTDRPPPRRQR
jgi:hypothetical protein